MCARATRRVGVARAWLEGVLEGVRLECGHMAAVVGEDVVCSERGRVAWARGRGTRGYA